MKLRGLKLLASLLKKGMKDTTKPQIFKPSAEDHIYSVGSGDVAVAGPMSRNCWESRTGRKER